MYPSTIRARPRPCTRLWTVRSCFSVAVGSATIRILRVTPFPLSWPVCDVRCARLYFRAVLGSIAFYPNLRLPLFTKRAVLARLAPRPHKLRLPSHRQLSSTSYLLITVHRCACACMVRDTPPLSCGQSSVSFCTHPHPSQPSCPQLPHKLHVLTSPVVLAFISCMLYIARSVFSWRCPIWFATQAV